jgi:hypothetical protein
VRFLAVVNRYTAWRYALATFLGRGLRFGILVLVGTWLLRLSWLGTVLTVLFVLYLLSLADLRRLAGFWQRLDEGTPPPPDERQADAPGEER